MASISPPSTAERAPPVQTACVNRDAFELWMIGRGLSRQTIRGYLNVYRLWEHWCQAQGIEPSQTDRGAVTRWLLGRQDRAPSTIRNNLLALRAYYRCARELGLRDDDPTAGMRGPKVRLQPVKPYEPQTLAGLLAAGKSPRDRALLALLMGAGLRASELAGLRTKDVDWGQGRILVRGKGNKTRLVAPGADVMKALGDYTDARTDALWGEITTTEGVRAWFFRLAKRAGVRKGNLHRFRHTFANAFLEAGGTEGQLQKLLGHSTLTMSLHYADNARERVALDQQQRLNVAGRLLADSQEVMSC